MQDAGYRRNAQDGNLMWEQKTWIQVGGKLSKWSKWWFWVSTRFNSLCGKRIEIQSVTRFLSFDRWRIISSGERFFPELNFKKDCIRQPLFYCSKYIWPRKVDRCEMKASMKGHRGWWRVWRWWSFLFFTMFIKMVNNSCCWIFLEPCFVA